MIPLLTSLSNVPFIGTIITFFSTKIRLIIEYFLIALVITMAGAMTTLWIQKKNQDKLIQATQERVVSLEIARDMQDKQIESLNALRERDSKSLEGLITDYKTLNDTDNAVRARLRKLEKTNEAVRAYLDGPIPDAYRCMLNHTCKDGNGNSIGNSKASGKPDSNVRKAK